MKKFKRVMLIIVTLIALIAFANISIKIYSSYKNDKYEDTVLPENLTAEETLYQLIDYWNNGNQKGISLICSNDYDISRYKPGEAYSFYEDKIRSEIVIDKFVDKTEFGIEQFTDIQHPYFDKHYFIIYYNSSDIECDWRSGGFGIFLIAREAPDSPYKICRIFSGW